MSRNLNPKIAEQKVFVLPYQKSPNFHEAVFIIIANDLMWKTLECYHL